MECRQVNLCGLLGMKQMILISWFQHTITMLSCQGVQVWDRLIHVSWGTPLCQTSHPLLQTSLVWFCPKMLGELFKKPLILQVLIVYAVNFCHVTCGIHVLFSYFLIDRANPCWENTEWEVWNQKTSVPTLWGKRWLPLPYPPPPPPQPTLSWIFKFQPSSEPTLPLPVAL